MGQANVVTTLSIKNVSADRVEALVESCHQLVKDITPSAVLSSLTSHKYHGNTGYDLTFAFASTRLADNAAKAIGMKMFSVEWPNDVEMWSVTINGSPVIQKFNWEGKTGSDLAELLRFKPAPPDDPIILG